MNPGLNVALCAARWLGTKEGSREHREILAVYNAIRPLPRGYAVRETDPWCAAFASVAAVMAGAGDRYPLECSCSKIIEGAKKRSIWQERDDHLPAIGDWVLYDWQSQPDGENSGQPDHVGVVIGIENGEILAVEGNFDNAVKLRRFPVDWEKLRGFVCPVWEEEQMIYHTMQDVPDYARPTVEMLVADGSLLGIAEDDLGLTEELLRTLVILDRRGRL